jgi:GDP-L-fucose synthase
LKKVLVTGGNGFIARSLTEKLSERFHIVACGKKQLDLTDSKQVETFLEREKFDVVIHSATYDAAPKHSSKDPNKVLEQNLSMFFNLCRPNHLYEKMIYFGSGAEFSRPYWQPKMTESFFGTQIPQDQYGLSKYIMTQHALLSDNIYNLRLFGVFGEFDDWRYRFISNICCHAVLGNQITVHQNALVDCLYIDDLIKTVRFCIENSLTHQVYNLCSGQAYEYSDLARMVAELAGGKKVEIENPEIKYEYSADNSLLVKEMPQLTFTPMHEALERMLKWYAEHRHLLSVSELHY